MRRVSTAVDTGWRFREAGKTSGIPRVFRLRPHRSARQQLIDDPFYRDNEQKLQWIGKTDWEYQTSFNLTTEIFARKNLELVFAGLDTYADIFSQ